MSATKDHVQSVYHRWAKQYDEDTSPKVNPSIAMEGDSLLTMLRPNLSDSILELGCGTGRLTLPIAKKCKMIVAIDRSDSMLEVARAKAQGITNIEFRKVDIATRKRLPFRPSSFDKAIAALVLNHINDIRPLSKR